MGIVGCGGAGDNPPAGETVSPATPKTSQAKVNEPSVESAAADPSVASESEPTAVTVAALQRAIGNGATIKKNEQGEVV